jgi:hypothetical protein
MVIIEENGLLTFLYRKVPELPFNFVDEFHPVTIGLADAHRQKVKILRKYLIKKINTNAGKEDTKLLKNEKKKRWNINE